MQLPAGASPEAQAAVAAKDEADALAARGLRKEPDPPLWWNIPGRITDALGVREKQRIVPNQPSSPSGFSSLPAAPTQFATSPQFGNATLPTGLEPKNMPSASAALAPSGGWTPSAAASAPAPAPAAAQGQQAPMPVDFNNPAGAIPLARLSPQDILTLPVEQFATAYKAAKARKTLLPRHVEAVAQKLQEAGAFA
jgi:hypothetical protein